MCISGDRGERCDGRPGERRRRNRGGWGRPEADQPEDREGSWKLWRPIDEGEASAEPAHRERGLRVAHVRYPQGSPCPRRGLEVDVDAGDEPGHCRAAAGEPAASAAATAPDSVQEGSFHPPLGEDEGEVARALKRSGVVRIGAEGGQAD